jgi:hypothetical protein
MEIITVWLLSIQFWNDPPPAMKFVYTKEYQTYEECMAARDKWLENQKNDQEKFQSLCLLKNKNVNTVGR